VYILGKSDTSSNFTFNGNCNFNLNYEQAARVAEKLGLYKMLRDQLRGSAGHEEELKGAEAKVITY
jgi:hypothetical protein